MSKENTSSLNNQTKGEVKKLEDYMSQVMRQNGMRFWELDMTGRRMEGMNSFGGKNLIEMSKKDIENVPEALFEGEMILEEDWEKCQEMFKELYSGKKENKAIGLTKGGLNTKIHAIVYRKRWYLANVKLDMFISILYVNIANLKSVPIEIFAEILNVFMIVRNIRQNSDVFYISAQKSHPFFLDGRLFA